VSEDILLVHVDGADSFSALAQLAQQRHARLVISTLAQPALFTDLAIGPLEVPAGATRSRRTDWQTGGHLWFEADLDGVVRHDRTLLDGDEWLPSLPSYAARRLRTADDVAAPLEPSADNGERRLRFYPAHAFTAIEAADAARDPARLEGKVLIAGTPAPLHATPVGYLSTPELVAQVLTGYRQDLRVLASPVGTFAQWFAALLVLSALALGAFRTRAGAWWLAGGGALSLALVSATAFRAFGAWLPVVGPAGWVLLTGSVLALRRSARTSLVAGDASIVEARRAAADGRLAEAWAQYRQISPSAALLPELYELACALDADGCTAHAAELFQRIAQIDGRFRDVAKRLVQCSHVPVEPVPDEKMPASMGRYQLLEPIGRGAMGYVYLGRDPMINRIVAIKAIDLTMEFDVAELPSASASFLREAEIAGGLSHPNIVTIFDVGETEGLAYIAMEYLKGHHLSEFATPDRLLPVDKVLELLSRTADGLDYAHAQNVVHRDIKPANIMYDSISDGLKITDFGIARLIDVSRTRTGVVLGTPAFMSPEQLEGKNVNGHTDLFALGVSLYQLLTGHLPFRGASMTKLMFVIANEPHPSVTTVRPELPQWLNTIVDRALAKDPADRYQSGGEMAAAMRAGIAQAA
jgi:serine/threonine-protein kinase